MTESICRNCIYLHGDAKSDPWYRWMCTRQPVDAMNYVTGGPVEPYVLCKYINSDGACVDFAVGPNVFQTREEANGQAA